MYTFDQFIVDPVHRRLLQASTRAPVDLSPRAFDLLLLMVERPGELLPKKDLMKALWPSVVVEENSLNQVVSTLRRVLGEKPAEHRFIVTAPGRGYRFVAAVQQHEQNGHPAEALSVAVLPFAAQDLNADNGYLGDALAADLIRNLALRPRLVVASQGSSFPLRSLAEGDVAEAARRLHVRCVVTGHVSQRGEDLIVSAWLSGSAGGAPLWSTTLQRPAGDIAALQADLARQVASAMDAAEVTRPASTPSVNPDAYFTYLRALATSQRINAAAAQETIDLLRQAIVLAPGFARARSALAIIYTSCAIFGFPVPRALDLAREEVAAALELDEQCGETHLAAAVIDCLGGAWSRAEERFRLAQSLTADPMVNGLRCGSLTSSVGQLQRALQQAEQLLRDAPAHSFGIHLLATVHATLGNDEAARRFTDLALELGMPANVAPLCDVLTHLALQQGDAQQIATAMGHCIPPRLVAAEGAPVIEALGHGRHRSDPAGTVRALRALEAAHTPAELDPPMRKRLICWYVLCGALDEAYDLAWRSLDHYAKEGSIGGAWGMLWLPEMRPFRDDPRFQPFARALRLFDFWNEFGPPDGYALAGDRLVAGH